MTTASKSVNTEQTLQGVWFPLDERLFRKRIERLADLAGNIDYIKVAIPDEDQRKKIADAVAMIHTVAMYYDNKNVLGLYAKEDVDCQEVRP